MNTPKTGLSGHVRRKTVYKVKRDEMAENLSSIEEEIPDPAKIKNITWIKKMDSLMSLIMKNQQEYNKFITKKDSRNILCISNFGSETVTNISL